MNRTRLFAGIGAAFGIVAACGTTKDPAGDAGGIDTSGSGGTGSGTGGTNVVLGGTAGSTGTGGFAGTIPPDSGPDVVGDGPMRDPNTCEEAVTFRTYLGCEFFPTVLPNVVDPIFDFAVVIANPSTETADIHVEGPAGFMADATVGARSLTTVYLPWQTALKGPSLDSAGRSEPLTASLVVAGGAYHVTTTRPVAAYQFNPLEFQAMGGPPGKTWTCSDTSSDYVCNSFANDASLLLPANALTPNYIAFSWRDASGMGKPNYIAVTATTDATEVVVKAGPGGTIVAGAAGTGIAQAGPGTVFALTLNRLDVAVLVGAAGSELSGTQVQASDETKPIQVMTGCQIANVPDSTVASGDHLEEIVFPAEAVGRDYVVTVPTGPFGMPVRHVVRLYGHANPSTLSYYPSKPAGAPDMLAAGEVAQFEASADFQVQGSTPFAVGSFLVGGALLDPMTPSQDRLGDPSQSLVTGNLQFRERYVFLAPADYQKSFVDIVAPAGATVTLDGTALAPATATSLTGRAADGTTEQRFDVYRNVLPPEGQHELSATAPVGIQVVGYGRFTSYQYPGGLNLNLITDPPPRPDPPR
ncbi:MAG TPA: IgGFc-binding protein [Polyangiaceae bacterium]